MPLYLKLLHLAFATELSALLPVVALLLLVGFATSFFQAAFQIEDATFSLLPKIIAMVFLALSGAFGLLTGFTQLTQSFILHAPSLVHQSWY